MENTRHYTYITANTVEGALDRVEAALSHMSDGHVDEVVELVRQYNELTEISKAMQTRDEGIIDAM